jgi:hypothetical protein
MTGSCLTNPGLPDEVRAHKHVWKSPGCLQCKSQETQWPEVESVRLTSNVVRVPLPQCITELWI